MKNLVLMFGGKSAEHEVSVRSAQSIYKALNKNSYKIRLIGIDKQGAWLEYSESTLLAAPLNTALPTHDKPASPTELLKGIDAVFSIIHGPSGEDGSMQGFLKTLGVPFVGPGILSSAICMDKDVMKRLLKADGIAITDFLVFSRRDQNNINYQHVRQRLGETVYVKPANMGSSVGVSKVTSESEFDHAVLEAFRYDTKILIEAQVVGREIECSVLGNQNPKASVIGEIVSEFYDYDSKYVNATAAKLFVPAEISDSLSEKARTVAVQAYQALCCEGLARVDMFLTESGDVLINELNTLPGFTSISMYPKLWEKSGLSYSDLIDELISLALERAETEATLAV